MNIILIRKVYNVSIIKLIDMTPCRTCRMKLLCLILYSIILIDEKLFLHTVINSTITVFTYLAFRTTDQKIHILLSIIANIH